MMRLRPFSWLKKMYRPQCMSQDRCCSCSSTGTKVLLSMASFSLFSSSRAPSQSWTQHQIDLLRTPGQDSNIWVLRAGLMQGGLH